MRKCALFGEIDQWISSKKLLIFSIIFYLLILLFIHSFIGLVIFALVSLIFSCRNLKNTIFLRLLEF